MTLKVQEYLKDHTLEQLHEEFGIEYVLSKNDSRVILNYSMINSPRSEQIVSECRGLVLDTKNWNIVAKAFNRFFNLGEMKGQTDKFIWKDSTATHKEDGSIILLYHYNNEWRVNTSGSFGDIKISDTNFTWRDLFFSALPDKTVLNEIEKYNTYVFELCSPYTQVVRVYSEPTLYFLSMFQNDYGYEYYDAVADKYSEILKVKRPTQVEFKDQFYAMQYIAKIAETDKIFEGLVVRDNNNLRLKIKNDFYVHMHQTINNHQMTVYRLADIVMGGNKDEILVHFPFLKDDINRISGIIDEWIYGMHKLWDKFSTVEFQKRYALEVKYHPLSGILFAAYKTNTSPYELLKQKEYRDIVVSTVSKRIKQ